MSLLNLISQLSSTEKTKLLGKETEEILRYSFTDKDTDAIPSEIIDLAIAKSKGHKIITKSSERRRLVESLRLVKIQELGFNDYNSAIGKYENSFQDFIKDFKIEDEYCVHEPKDNRKSREFILPEHGKCNGVLAFPHDYQLRLKDQINEILRNKRDCNILATMPTGAGKTVLAMEIITDLFRSYTPITGKKLQICWVVDRQELCEQSLQSFQKIWKQKGDRKVVCQRFFEKFTSLESLNENTITFATFTLLEERKSNPEVIELLKNTDLLLIDEAHGSNALTYRNVIEKHKMLSSTGFRIGLTATPFRNDDSQMSSLKSLFQTYLSITDENNRTVASPMKYLISQGFLSEIKTQVLNSERANNTNSEYYKYLHKAVANECKELIKKGENTIIFAQSKSHAIALNIYLKMNGIENGLIVGETPTIYRKIYLERFGNKTDNLSVIVNHQILSTGIDVPGMNSIMILAEISSPALALQIIGRAMRGEKNGGNKSNTIYLTLDNYKKLESYEMLEDIVLQS